MKNNFIKFPLILSIFGILATLLLATFEKITRPIIEANLIKQEETSIQTIFPESTLGKVIELNTKNIVYVVEVFEGQTVISRLYKITGVGYKNKVCTYLIGISPDGKFNGYAAIDLPEQTSGIGQRVQTDQAYIDSFLNQSIDMTFPIISGATYTSGGLKEAVNAAVAHYKANPTLKG